MSPAAITQAGDRAALKHATAVKIRTLLDGRASSTAPRLGTTASSRSRSSSS